jgi:hypothetical protein
VRNKIAVLIDHYNVHGLFDFSNVQIKILSRKHKCKQRSTFPSLNGTANALRPRGMEDFVSTSKSLYRRSRWPAPRRPSAPDTSALLAPRFAFADLRRRYACSPAEIEGQSNPAKQDLLLELC